MPTNILLVNSHATLNNGDASLALTSMQLLRQNFGEAHLTIAMDVPDDYPGVDRTVPSLVSWVKNLSAGHEPTWRKLNLLLLLPITLLVAGWYRVSGRFPAALVPARLRPTLRAYAEADLLVSIPGGFMFSSGLGITLVLALYTVYLAILFGKPAYIFPQSYGPIAPGWQARLVAWVLGRVRLVMTRERVSVDILQRCGFPPERILVFPDLAFAFEGEPLEQGRAWLAERGMHPGGDIPYLAITPLNWAAQNRRFGTMDPYLAALEAAILWFIEHKGGNVLLLAQVFGPEPGEDDRPLVRLLSERLFASHPEYRSRLLASETQLPPGLIKAIFGCSDLVIGTHMHSNIFALAHAVPVVPIGYRPKTKGIAQTAGVERFVIEITDINPETMLAVLERCWAERSAVRAHLRALVPDLAVEARRAVRLCYEDYMRLRGAG
jgi:colanic acid/amylovoran biosynthesis protein